MPDPVISPVPPAPAAPVVVTTDPIKPEPSVTPPTNEGTTVSTNVAGSIIMPAVVYAPPRVFGEVPTDRGDEAEFIVNHHRFGEFIRGSRIALSDVVNPKDIPAFLAMGAISELPKREKVAQLTPETPASDAPADPAPKPKGK